MKYSDKIYGEVVITEPIILELMKNSSLQRLKEIDQAGYYEPYFPGTKHNRFEHSIGVYLLLKKYGASPEEKIAGLIHDVSHSAFSHCIDYVVSDGSGKKQCHQDRIFKEFFLKSEIPKIFKKYGLDANYIANEKNFPLLETNLPDLCADRIDYSLRGMLAYGLQDVNQISEILKSLRTFENKWVFQDFPSANRYAKLFMNLNKKYYAALETAVMFHRVSDYLIYALKKKYIGENDLYKTDKWVLDKVNKKLPHDEKLKKYWKNMNNGKGYKNDPSGYNVHVFCKSRVVDPLCWHESKMKRVSEIDKKWGEIIKSESKPKEYFIKFED